MLGTGYGDLLIHKEFQQGNPNLLVAVKSLLNWMIIGNYSVKHEEGINVHDLKNCNSISKTSSELLSKQIERLCEIEPFDITEFHQQKPLTLPEKRAFENLEKNSTFKESHFEVPSLWTIKDLSLLNNR